MSSQKSDISKYFPRHIAIIMDGNGRWATRRNLPRTIGHKQGAEAARRVVRAATELGIEYITLFGFSSENWRRPKDEINELMRLLRFYLRAETAELHSRGARLRVIGERSGLDEDIVHLIEHAEALTKNNTRINVVIALNYGGRQDLLQAAKKFATQLAEDRSLQQCREKMEAAFSSGLMTAGMPDPDILIRTSGEQRISNFLLWQCAYAEFVFSDKLWPDFTGKDLENAIKEYQLRDRRFGALKAATE